MPSCRRSAWSTITWSRATATTPVLGRRGDGERPRPRLAFSQVLGLGELHGNRLVPHPARAHGLPYERTHGRRMRPAAHREQVDLPPDFRLDQRPHDDVPAIEGAVLRHETEAETGRHHGQNPVVAFAAIDAADLRSILQEDLARVIDHLAIGAVE